MSSPERRSAAKTRGSASRWAMLAAAAWATGSCGLAAGAQPVELEFKYERVVDWGGDLVRHEHDHADLRGRPIVPARSWRALRDAGVVRQKYDYSCGSAALATLLAGGGESVTETEILLEVLSGLSEEDKAQTMEAGLSLLDLKGAAERRGRSADGYRVPPELLPRLTQPVIVFIQPRGYRHFAVLRGVRGDRIYLADPARGNVRYPVWKFLEMWLDPEDPEGRGAIFVVESEAAPTPELAGRAASQPELLGARQLLGIGPSTLRPLRLP